MGARVPFRWVRGEPRRELPLRGILSHEPAWQRYIDEIIGFLKEEECLQRLGARI